MLAGSGGGLGGDGPEDSDRGVGSWKSGRWMELMKLDAKCFDSVIDWDEWFQFYGGLWNADDCFERAR